MKKMNRVLSTHRISLSFPSGALLALLLIVGHASFLEADPPACRPESGSATCPVDEDFDLYSDDMQNGRFDAMVSSGSDTYSVVDAGDGNLAARLTGSKTLKMSGVAWTSITWEDYDVYLRVKRSAAGTVGLGFRWISSLPHAPSVTDRGYWLENNADQWSLKREIGGATATLQTVAGPAPIDEWYQLRISVRTVSKGSKIRLWVNRKPVMKYLDTTPIPFGGLAFRTEGAGTELWLDDCKVVEHVDTRYTWSQTGGPQGADWVASIVVDPRDWRVAYIGGTDAGLFKTIDGGASWREVGLAHELWTPRIKTIELAPSNPSMVYAGTGGKHVGTLWRSDDGGATWHWSATSDIDPEAETNGVAVDAWDPMHIYFSLTASKVGPGPTPGVEYGVYESRNGGTTATPRTSLGNPIGPVEIDPGDGNHILAGSLDAATSGASIIGSTNGGERWDPSDAGINGNDVRQILFYSPDPSYVFAVAVAPGEEDGRVYRSTDGGGTWAALTSLPAVNILDLSRQTEPMLLAFGPSGMHASTNKGDSWSPFANASCVGAPFVVGMDDPNVIYSSIRPNVMVSTDLGQTCSNEIKGLLANPVAGLGVAPSDAAVVYVGTLSSLHKSIDGGETWTYLRKGQFAGIAVDPVDSNTVYIGAAEFARVLKSTDGGETWTDISGPITFPGVSTLAIDPQDRMTVYAGTGHGPQMGPGGGGLYKSPDGGQSWSKLSGIPDVAVPVVAIDPTDSAHIVVGTSGYGVLVSDDGGATFEPRNNGLLTGSSGPFVWALALDPRDPGVIYAGTNAFYPAAAGAPPDALYKTIDGGLNWTVLLAGEEVPDRGSPFLYFGCCVDAISINQERPDEVYVALHDPGILFTDNGGEDWRYVNHGLVPLLTHMYPYRVAFSAGGKSLYATSCGRSIFRNNVDSPEPSSKSDSP